VPAAYFIRRRFQALQKGRAFESRRVGTSPPFFTSDAMIAGLPLKSTLEPGLGAASRQAGQAMRLRGRPDLRPQNVNSGRQIPQKDFGMSG
jgi:hypothetical protein